jgi:DNA-binding response OmpR family regulator
MPKKRILVVEDDAALARGLRDNLAYCGFEVACAADGNVALAQIREFAPDLVVLDVMLPGTNGFDLCGVLRQGSRTPIIILTARSQKLDKLRGLNLGADDYMTKPFDLEELLARVHAVLRRARPAVEQLALGRLVIDFRAQHATKAGHALHLTHREFELLHISPSVTIGSSTVTSCFGRCGATSICPTPVQSIMRSPVSGRRSSQMPIIRGSSIPCTATGIP